VHTVNMTRAAFGQIVIAGIGAIDGPAITWADILTLTAATETLNLTATAPSLTLEATCT